MQMIVNYFSMGHTLIFTSWASCRRVMLRSSKMATSTLWMVSLSMAECGRSGVRRVSTDVRLHLNWWCQCLTHLIESFFWCTTFHVQEPQCWPAINCLHYGALVHFNNRKWQTNTNGMLQFTMWQVPLPATTRSGSEESSNEHHLYVEGILKYFCQIFLSLFWLDLFKVSAKIRYVVITITGNTV